MKRGRIVVGFADALAAVEAVWSLQSAGFEVTAFTRRGRKPSAALIPGLELVPVTAPERDVSATIREVEALLGTLRPNVIMPLDDAAVFVLDAVDSSEAVVAGPTGVTADFALDKRVQFDAAAAAGFAVPQTQLVETIDDLESLTRFPLVLKPRKVLSERDGALVRASSFFCGNRAELDLVRARWRGAHPLLAQDRVRGTGYGLFGIATAGGVRAWSAHERIRMMNPAGSGSSACRSASVDGGLTAIAQSFLDAVAWRGQFMIELLRDGDGRAWFMELNGRPWGSLALARRLGLEYPAWSAALALDSSFRLPEPEPTASGVVCRNLGREIVHVLSVLRGPRSSAIDDWPSARATLHDVLRVRRSERWYNSRPGARRLFWYDAWRTLSGEIRGSG